VTLDPERGARVSQAAAEQMSGLVPEAFVHRDEVVMAWAEPHA
jgi:hypothetical protein